MLTMLDNVDNDMNIEMLGRMFDTFALNEDNIIKLDSNVESNQIIQLVDVDELPKKCMLIISLVTTNLTTQA